MDHGLWAPIKIWPQLQVSETFQIIQRKSGLLHLTQSQLNQAFDWAVRIFVTRRKKLDLPLVLCIVQHTPQDAASSAQNQQRLRHRDRQGATDTACRSQGHGWETVSNQGVKTLGRSASDDFAVTNVLLLLPAYHAACCSQQTTTEVVILKYFPLWLNSCCSQVVPSSIKVCKS